MIDYTKLLRKLDKDPAGEDPGLRLRTAVVDAVNANGTVDLILSGGLVPSVPVLDGVNVADGAVVQVLAARGSLLVLGGSAGGGAGKATVYNNGNPTFTATTYGSFSAGNVHGVAFVAPASGAVQISVMGWMAINSGTLRCRAYLTGQVRTGSVIDSGSIVDAGNDNQAAAYENDSTGAYTYIYQHVSYVVTGLTAGSLYNVVSVVRVEASPAISPGNAAVNKRRLIVKPW